MRKKIIIIITIRKSPLFYFFFIFLTLILSSCSNNKVTTKSSNSANPSITTPIEDTTLTTKLNDDPYMNIIIELKIGNSIVDVYRFDNDSEKIKRNLLMMA